MIPSPPDIPRLVIPKWRKFCLTAEAGDLAAAAAKPKRRSTENLGTPVRGQLPRRLSQFRKTPSIISAAEAVMAALVAGEPQSAVSAAEFLRDSHATPELKRLARAICCPNPADQSLTQFDENKDAGQSTHFAAIREARARLVLEPRNAVQWIDIALSYIAINADQRARRAISAALGLAPNDRFVLRAAARYFVHCKEYDRAHDLLIRSDATSADPWLAAAEISIARLAERSPINARGGRYTLDANRFPPRAVAELAAALATLEMESGSLKKARKLFGTSLIDPNENALAQAAWAAHSRHVAPEPKADLYLRPYAYEARVSRAYADRHWMQAVTAAEQWMLDEPYTVTPAVTASYIADALMMDSERAERITRVALAHHPTNFTLINNRAVALARLGKVMEARDLLSKLPTDLADPRELVVKTATAGLIEFRAGNAEAGITLYLEAIEHAKRCGEHALAYRAQLHCAFELARHSPLLAEGALQIARSIPTSDKILERDAMVPLIEAMATKVDQVVPRP